jgi:transposase-like protein
MEKSGKRGKIPQSDWPLIMARYEQGETLSSIARTYDCSPPAISYIVSRSREKTTAVTAPVPAAEAQLIKTSGNGAAGNGSAPVEPTETSSPQAAQQREIVADLRPPASPNTVSANGASANGGSGNGGSGNGAEQRPKLHLSLGNAHGGGGNNVSSNGNGRHHEPAAAPAGGPNERSPQPQAAGNGHRPLQPPRNPSPFDAGRDGGDLFALPTGKPAQQPRDPEAPHKDNGAFIGAELRNRVDGDIAAFLAAFDAALTADTQESRFGLREATDRLLRAGARTRIELERLEARVPLTPREGRVAEPAWRYR